jgi:hypothetical protein
MIDACVRMRDRFLKIAIRCQVPAPVSQLSKLPPACDWWLPVITRVAMPGFQRELRDTRALPLFSTTQRICPDRFRPPSFLHFWTARI